MSSCEVTLSPREPLVVSSNSLYHFHSQIQPTPPLNQSQPVQDIGSPNPGFPASTERHPLCNTFPPNPKQNPAVGFIIPQHRVLHLEKMEKKKKPLPTTTSFSFHPAVFCGVKLHIIKLKASMNYVEYNGLNKPRIIVIKAAETSQCNEWSTNHTRQSDNVLLGMLVHSGRPREDTWGWKEKGDYK